MTPKELRETIRSIIGEYFPNTDIVWAEQKELVKPKNTFLMLTMRNLDFVQHPITVEENGENVIYRPSSVMLEVQLFTKGSTEYLEVEGRLVRVSVNTALTDLMDLANYLTSTYANELYDKYNIAIRAEGGIQDVSGVVDSDYEYRARQDFVVDFMQTCNGRAGISRDDWQPTASGGGTQELADSNLGEIDNVDIKETEN